MKLGCNVNWVHLQWFLQKLRRSEHSLHYEVEISAILNQSDRDKMILVECDLGVLSIIPK